jgi:hypothetical protein
MRLRFTALHKVIAATFPRVDVDHLPRRGAQRA